MPGRPWLWRMLEVDFVFRLGTKTHENASNSKVQPFQVDFNETIGQFCGCAGAMFVEFDAWQAVAVANA